MKALIACIAAFGVLAGCQFLVSRSGALAASPQTNKETTNVGTRPGGIGKLEKLTPAPGNQLAAFSGGCFWGTERYFRHVKGVVATAVGYTGGSVAHPTYDMVSTHLTGHAETVLLEFNPKIVTYKQLLQDFWDAHDPTTLDQQGPDIGSNYRSAIWTFNSDEAAEANASLAADQKKETSPIVTEIHPLGMFWLAEDYHQQYDEKTGTNTCPAPRHGAGQ
jgi:peptide-methionine (S)-S-oxide reductase